MSEPETIGHPFDDVVRAEMLRIKRLFGRRSDGDGEDLISYAKEIVALRVRLGSLQRELTAMTKLADKEGYDRVMAENAAATERSRAIGWKKIAEERK